MKKSSKFLVFVGIMLLISSFATVWAQGQTEVADDGKIVIGLSHRRIAGSDWYKTLVDGVKYGAGLHGAEVIVLDANGDTVRQNVDVNTLINKNVDVIIINANDPIGLSSSLRAAKEAGIPVVAVNSALDESLMSEIYGYVVEDQVATGARGGYILAETVAERNPGLKEAKAVIVGGYPGDILSDLRAEGYMKGYQQWLDENPGKGVKLNYLPMQYGHWIPNDAMPVVRDIATAHPDLKVVFNESCVMLSGIEQALKAAGVWENITMASYDGYQSVVKEMIDNPDGPVQALTTNEPYRQGLTAVEMALRAIDGGSPEGTVFVETVAFGVDNAAQYYDSSKVLVDTVQ